MHRFVRRNTLLFLFELNISSSVKLHCPLTHTYIHTYVRGDYAYRILICTCIDGKNSIRTLVIRRRSVDLTCENVIVHPQIPIESWSFRNGLLGFAIKIYRGPVKIPSLTGDTIVLCQTRQISPRKERIQMAGRKTPFKPVQQIQWEFLNVYSWFRRDSSDLRGN